MRFACQPGCIRCCDARGFVYITERDLVRIAKFLHLTPAEFEQRFVIRYHHVLRLRKPRNSQCHFLKTDGCSIHPVKPVQCRTYPFWPELIEDRSAWRAESKSCPGIGKGELIQIGEACQIAHEMKIAYPAHYERPNSTHRREDRIFRSE